MCSENIEDLKLKLKSVTKIKLSKDIEVCNLRNLDRSLIEFLRIKKNENSYLEELLQDLKSEISKVQQQISIIDVCKTSEKVKIESHKDEINKHYEDFENLFKEEKEKIELHNKQIRVKEAEHHDILMQQQVESQLRNEIQLQEAMAIEAETEALEKECAVLKKRNTAIMLKLRRKLIETEEARRKLMQKVN